MKFYVIAGEASGDLHASDLIREIKIRLPQSEFRAWGGELMKAEGAEVVKHYRDLAFMGFSEVILNLKTIMNNFRFCKKDILDYKADAIILVDYPGFNLRIAEFAYKIGIPVYYYISPQVWAWKSSRVWKIKRIVKKMFVILPFEKDFYKKYDYHVDYVGHPLPDVIERNKKQFSDSISFLKKHNLNEKPVVALLPGSRKQEINTILPLMRSVRKHFPEYQFVIAAAPSQPLDYYKQIAGSNDIKIISGATYELLNNSKAALVTSGTATLETALMNVPQVVCYKGGRVSYFIARSLVKIKFISLVNLIMDKEVVKELIQKDLNTASLSIELKKILEDGIRVRILNDYRLLSEKLSGGGAARRTAEGIINDLKSL